MRNRLVVSGEAPNSGVFVTVLRPHQRVNLPLQLALKNVLMCGLKAGNEDFRGIQRDLVFVILCRCAGICAGGWIPVEVCRMAPQALNVQMLLLLQHHLYIAGTHISIYADLC